MSTAGAGPNRPRALVRAVASLVMVAGAALAPLQGAEAAGTMRSHAIIGDKADMLASPNATAHFGCELRPFAGTRLFCYGPAAIRKAYGVDGFIAQGLDGRGQTIVIIDAYGSPTVTDDLAAFDAAFGLPPPASFREIRLGAPFDATDPNQIGWAEEVSLDVQWSHAIAPGANIVLISAASNNDSDLLAALNYALDNKLGSIVSESFGESEYGLISDTTGAGVATIAGWEAGYSRARRHGVTVLVSSGDSGSSDPDTDANGVPLVPFPVVQYPASSPNVTAVGGTNLFFGTLGAADPNGSYLTESVWNDGFGAGGGGVSQYFAVPGYQSGALPASTLSVLNGYRGVPDVAYNAGVVGGVIAHLGFLGANSGFYIFGGTSAGAPQWAGITSIVNQYNGRPVGFLNNVIYGRLGRGANDTTAGQNGFNGVKGYVAAPTWDLSTGWGTPTATLIRTIMEEE